MICKAASHPDQVRTIHEVSLSILERVGVEVPHAEILRRFADSGAQVDFEKQHVKIPADLVMRSIEQAGKQFILYGQGRCGKD